MTFEEKSSRSGAANPKFAHIKRQIRLRLSAHRGHTSGEKSMKLLHRRRLLYLSRIVVTIGFAIALAAPTPSEAAEIKVLTSRAMNHVLTELGGTFERSTGHKVMLILAVPTEIAKRVVNGEIVDVVMSGATVDNLVKQGKIAPGDRIILARVGIGVAVRAGAPKPDISSPEALKRTLLAAKSIVYTDPAIGGASGIQFEKVIDRLGIAKEIKAKSILNARAATKPSAEFVARGEAELGIQLISEIVSVPGAELLGPLPGDLQAMTAILAGIVTTAPEPDAARALLRFLTSPAAAAAIKAAGMEPGGS
jgi:molybdate transport system substrate-binding protein